MVKPLVFMASLLAGGGFIAFTVGMQKHRAMLAEPTIEPTPIAVHLVPPAAAVHEPEPEPVVMVPELVIEPRRAKPAAPLTAVEETPAEPETRPCSSWRDLGPVHVASERVTGSHAVRELCP